MKYVKCEPNYEAILPLIIGKIEDLKEIIKKINRNQYEMESEEYQALNDYEMNLIKSAVMRMIESERELKEQIEKTLFDTEDGE